MSQSWSQVIRQTEALGRVMRSHADDLNSGPLHRLATLIRDKQQLKKSYQSLHQQLESHNHKVGGPPPPHARRQRAGSDPRVPVAR